MSGVTTDPSDPRLGRGADEKPVAQHDVYLVLSDEERAKGWVRPFRDTYKHAGRHVCGKVRQFDGDVQPWLCIGAPGHAGECSSFTKANDIGEIERAGKHNRLGGCGTTTTMGRAIAETYARDPNFYGSTYCVKCRMHRPLFEFVWDGDGSQVGS